MTALRTTVIGSYPFPGWLEYAAEHLEDFGADDVSELQEDAVIAAVHDQVAAGLDAISDGEQTRLDFNLGFYGFLEGVEQGSAPRLLGPPAHDQRPRHRVVGELSAPDGLGTVAEYERLRRVAPPGPSLKVAVPGPYTLAGRLEGDRWETAEALLPIVQAELVALADAGCGEIAIDEPSMSCYAHREDPERLVALFNRTVTPVVGRARLSTHLCFGNYKGQRRRAAAVRTALPGISRGRRRRDPPRDGKPRAGRGGDRGHHRRGEGRRRRCDRRQELLRRDAR